ncbi:hypothetical protein LCGC14_2166430, partial [marine sediment metagenome]
MKVTTKHVVCLFLLLFVCLGFMGIVKITESKDKPDNTLQIAAGESLTITNPTGSASWEVNSTQTITWTYTGFIPAVSIELYKDNYLFDILVQIAVNDGNFVWDVPIDLPNGVDYQIKIRSYQAGAINDFSDNFEIWGSSVVPKSINIINPTGSSSWLFNNDQTIIWSSTGDISWVDIDLYKGNSYYTFIGLITGNDGSYTWSVPIILPDGTDYQVKISDYHDPSISDMSDYFEIWDGIVIPKSISISNPSSSSSWEPRTSRTIMWSSTGDIDEVNIALYNNTYLIEAIDNRVFNDGRYAWTIPSYLEEGSNYKIRISDYNNATIYGDSESFEIYIPIASKTIHITSPDSLNSWEVGTTQTITWTSTGAVGNVRIQIYKDGEFLQIVSFSTSNTGSFHWFIPYSLESKDSYQIKI